MAADEESPITLSREDLYELVWSKPKSELAKDFGISDVALAKRCRRLGIPVPGRGYWARIDGGQKPYRPKLPKREPRWFDHGALTATPSENAPLIPKPTATDAEDKKWLDERLAFEANPSNKIVVPETTRTWNPAIRICRDELEKGAKELRDSRKAEERYERMPEWRKRSEIHSDTWRWRHAKDSGQRISDTHNAVAFRVSLDTYKRALAVVNALALAAASRGFTVRANDEIGRVVFSGHDANVQLRITELLEIKTRPRVRYDGKTEQEKYKVPTGNLRITLQISYQEGPSVGDGASQTLESQLNRVFEGMYKLVVKAWREDRRDRERQRQRDEAARIHAERERLRIEHEKALAEERDRRRRLSSETVRWAKSRRIREYVEHIQLTAAERAEVSSDLRSWADWALRVASELDPTNSRIQPTREDAPTS